MQTWLTLKMLSLNYSFAIVYLILIVRKLAFDFFRVKKNGTLNLSIEGTL